MQAAARHGALPVVGALLAGAAAASAVGSMWGASLREKPGGNTAAAVQTRAEVLSPCMPTFAW